MPTSADIPNTLLNDLQDVFPSGSSIVSRPEKICSCLSDEEALDVTRVFFCKTWKNVPPDAWLRSSVISCLTPDALLYYMPSLLSSILLFPDTVSLSIDALLSDLRIPHDYNCVPKNERKFALSEEKQNRMKAWRDNRWERFNLEQLLLIKRVIEWLETKNDCHFDRAQIRNALMSLDGFIVIAISSTAQPLQNDSN